MAITTPLRTFAFCHPSLSLSSLSLLSPSWFLSREKVVNVPVYMPMWKSLLCICNVFVYCMFQLPQFYLKSVLLLGVGLQVCVMAYIENGWQGTGYRLRPSQPAASRLGIGSWWIAIHKKKSTLPSSANTYSLACLQGDIPKLLSTRGLKALQQGWSQESHTQGKTGRVSVSVRRV